MISPQLRHTLPLLLIAALLYWQFDPLVAFVALGIGIAIGLLILALRLIKQWPYRLAVIAAFALVITRRHISQFLDLEPAQLLLLLLLTGALAALVIIVAGKRTSALAAQGRARSVMIAVVAIAILYLTPHAIIFAWLGGGSLFNKFDQWRYPPITTFDAARWKSPNLKYRYSALSYLVDTELRPGMTAKELTDLLGEPDRITSDGRWHYETKRPGWRFIDFSGGGLQLIITPEGTLSEAINHT